jgi:hypothetical protein
MKTKESMASVCGATTGRDRKILIVFGGIVLLLVTFMAIASAFWKFYEVNNRGDMMYGAGNEFGRGKVNTPKNKSNTIGSQQNNDFVMPDDALRGGEIAIVVNNLESAKKEISNVSTKGGGNIYATFISYASDEIKNGSIIVQIPAENFDIVFANLKKIGVQIVQESTKQIPLRSAYIMPVPMNAEAGSVSGQNKSEVVASPDVIAEGSRDIAIYPSPQSTFIQNKAYIRVVLVDYGNQEKNVAVASRSKQGINNGIDVDNVRQNLLLIVGLKLIFVVAIFGLMLVLFKKILRRIRDLKKEKKAVHVVRQMPKTHARAVRVQKSIRAVKK